MNPTEFAVLAVLAGAAVIYFSVHAKKRPTVSAGPSGVIRPPPPVALPGVPQRIPDAMVRMVDSPGLSISDTPTSRRGFENSDVDVVLKMVMRRLVGSSAPQSIDPYVTDVESTICQSNAAGTTQFEIIFTFHDAVTVTSTKAFVRVLSLADGVYMIGEFRPYTLPPPANAPSGSAVVSPVSSEYTFPVGRV